MASLSAEVDRAKTAEGESNARSLTALLEVNQEITRAMGVETTLTSGLASEVARAEAVEAVLITSKDALTSGLSDEIVRAQAQEALACCFVILEGEVDSSGDVYFACGSSAWLQGSFGVPVTRAMFVRGWSMLSSATTFSSPITFTLQCYSSTGLHTAPMLISPKSGILSGSGTNMSVFVDGAIGISSIQTTAPVQTRFRLCLELASATLAQTPGAILPVVASVNDGYKSISGVTSFYSTSNFSVYSGNVSLDISSPSTGTAKGTLTTTGGSCFVQFPFTPSQSTALGSNGSISTFRMSFPKAIGSNQLTFDSCIYQGNGLIQLPATFKLQPFDNNSMALASSTINTTSASVLSALMFNS